MMNLLKIKQRRLPWWSSGWKSSCQCRGYGFTPWSGKIPHASGHLNPCATTTESHAPQILCSATRDATTRRSLHTAIREYFPLTTRETLLCAATKTQHSHFCCPVAKSCKTLRPHGLQHNRLPCPSHLLEFPQTHVHWVCEAIQPSYPLLPSSPVLNYK